MKKNINGVINGPNKYPDTKFLLVLEQNTRKTSLGTLVTFVGIRVAFSIRNKSFKPLGYLSGRVRSREENLVNITGF